MTQEILKRAFEALDNLLYWDNGKPEYDEAREAITAIKEALREHAMREVQRLGQEIEQEPVDCEKLALLGWQAVECSICGSSAKAFTKPEQEPVAWMWDINNGAGYSSRGIGFYQTDIPFAKHTPLYTAPPQRTWVGLTDEEYIHITDSVYHQGHGLVAYYKAIEAKLKEKNT